MTGVGAGIVAVLATLDTKEEEAAYVRGRLLGVGAGVRVLDIGTRRVDRDWVELAADEVAARGGRTLEDLRAGGRDTAMATMAVGASLVLGTWAERGRLQGVIALGGNQGTSIAAGAMRGLPYGIPKIIVSTVASGNVRDYVQDCDITMMFSVGDLLGGPNEVTEPVLRGAVGALVGMMSVAGPPLRPDDEPVAVTAFGNTHAGVLAAIDRLAEHGRRAIVFHASGACGSAMERLIGDGLFGGVLDLTTHELLGELYPADVYAPVRPGRLTAAGRAGVAQVVVPGGLHYHCFGGPASIPSALRDRPVHHHNPQNTNVRASAEELEHVAEVMAERLNAAHGPVTVLVPARGWSEVGAPGGVLHDPEGDHRFVQRLTRCLEGHVPCRVVDSSINDAAFATEAVDTLVASMVASPSNRNGVFVP